MTPDPTLINIPPAIAAVTVCVCLGIADKPPANLSNSKITLSVAAHRQKTILPEPMNSLARRQINRASVADERTERVADIMANDEIGNIVLLGRFVIDDNELSARAFRH